MSSATKPGFGDAAVEKTDRGTSAGVSSFEAVSVNLTVNGEPRTVAVEPRMTLLDALRENLALTGTKKACDRGECGACTMHIDGRRVLSCMALAAMQEGKRITTIEGLEQKGTLHPLQSAFIEHDGFQCGFCTSGQIMSAVAMMTRHAPIDVMSERGARLSQVRVTRERVCRSDEMQIHTLLC